MKPDLTDYQNNSKNDSEQSSRMVSWIVLGLALSGFLALAWYAYQSGSESVAQHEIPTIKADTSPIKVRPEEAGGETFPHQDKTIYDVIAEDRSAGRVEKLIPEPEEPIIPTVQEVVDAEVNEQKASTWVNERLRDANRLQEPLRVSEPEPEETPDEIPAEPVNKPEPKSEPAPKPKAEPKADPAPEPKPEVKKPEPKAEPVAKPKPKPEPKPIEEPKAPAASGGHKLQLGAFGSNEEAEKNWKRIQDKHPLVLGGMPHVIVRADLPKGTFYRLRVAGFSSKDAAAAACTKLKAAGQGCYYAGK